MPHNLVCRLLPLELLSAANFESACSLGSFEIPLHIQVWQLNSILRLIRQLFNTSADADVRDILQSRLNSIKILSMRMFCRYLAFTTIRRSMEHTSGPMPSVFRKEQIISFTRYVVWRFPDLSAVFL